MSRFGSSRIWRAIAVAWGLSLTCLPTELIAGSVNSLGVAEGASRSEEPFGISTAKVTTGVLLEKWLVVEREIDAERLVLKICEENRASCRSQAALEFLAIVDSGRILGGRAQLGEINRAINLKITPMSDLALYGTEDFWSSPLATFTKGAGDCEDYAIAKFVALRLAGMSPDDLRIVVLRDTINGEGHAVAMARLDQHWLTLDNRRMAMVEDTDVRNIRPLFVIDENDVMKYVDTAPAMVLNYATQPGLISPSN